MIDFYRLRGSSEKEKLFNRTILYPSLDVHHLVHPSSSCSPTSTIQRALVGGVAEEEDATGDLWNVIIDNAISYRSNGSARLGRSKLETNEDRDGTDKAREPCKITHKIKNLLSSRDSWSEYRL